MVKSWDGFMGGSGFQSQWGQKKKIPMNIYIIDIYTHNRSAILLFL